LSRGSCGYDEFKPTEDVGLSLRPLQISIAAR